MSRSIFLFVVRAETRMPSLLQTSTLWRPMLPVEPRMIVHVDHLIITSGQE